MRIHYNRSRVAHILSFLIVLSTSIMLQSVADVESELKTLEQKRNSLGLDSVVLCNDTSNLIEYATASDNRQRQWQAHGWIPLPADTCKLYPLDPYDDEWMAFRQHGPGDKKGFIDMGYYEWYDELFETHLGSFHYARALCVPQNNFKQPAISMANENTACPEGSAPTPFTVMWADTDEPKKPADEQTPLDMMRPEPFTAETLHITPQWASRWIDSNSVVEFVTTRNRNKEKQVSEAMKHLPSIMKNSPKTTIQLLEKAFISPLKEANKQEQQEKIKQIRERENALAEGLREQRVVKCNNYYVYRAQSMYMPIAGCGRDSREYPSAYSLAMFPPSSVSPVVEEVFRGCLENSRIPAIGRLRLREDLPPMKPFYIENGQHQYFDKQGKLNCNSEAYETDGHIDIALNSDQISRNKQFPLQGTWFGEIEVPDPKNYNKKWASFDTVLEVGDWRGQLSTTLWMRRLIENEISESAAIRFSGKLHPEGLVLTPEEWLHRPAGPLGLGRYRYTMESRMSFDIKFGRVLLRQSADGSLAVASPGLGYMMLTRNGSRFAKRFKSAQDLANSKDRTKAIEKAPKGVIAKRQAMTAEEKELAQLEWQKRITEERARVKAERQRDKERHNAPELYTLKESKEVNARTIARVLRQENFDQELIKVLINSIGKRTKILRCRYTGGKRGDLFFWVGDAPIDKSKRELLPNTPKFGGLHLPEPGICPEKHKY